ncbi:MAG: alginate export family protein [Nitrospinae bacterium]|nr:alginate export family protein [Nitrospinota bacterium]
MSGQIRLRPEARENADFDGAKDDKQAFIGSRARLTVDAKVSDGVSAKLTIQDVRQWGQESNVNTAMEGATGQALDVFEGYFQVNEIGGTPVSAKAGRQTLVYGDQRLLGHLEWKDEARTHDALKLMAALGQVKLDLFISKEAESGKPSDEKNDDDLLGAYAMTSLTEGLTLDLYAIQWKTANKDADGAAIKGKNIMTYGARAAANFGPVDATGEAAFQSGDWSSGVTHSASAFAVKAGFTTTGTTWCGPACSRPRWMANPARTRGRRLTSRRSIRRWPTLPLRLATPFSSRARPPRSAPVDRTVPHGAL